MFREDDQRSEVIAFSSTEVSSPRSRGRGLVRSPSTMTSPAARHQVARSHRLTVTRHATCHNTLSTASFSRSDMSGTDTQGQALTSREADLAALYTSAIAVAALLYHAYLFWAIYKTWSKSTDWCHGTRLLAVITILVYAALLARFSVRHATKQFASQIELISFIFQEKTITAAAVVWLLAVLLVLLHSLWDARKNPRTIIPMAGAIIILVAAFAFSYNRSRIVWAGVFRCIVLHYATGAMLLKWDVGFMALNCVAHKFLGIARLMAHGSTFMFEHLAAGVNMTEHLGDLAHGHNVTNISAVFGFRLLPFFFFWGLLIRLTYWFGFTRHVVLLLSRCIRLVTGATICEGITAMSSMFLSSALMLLTVEPFINMMTLSELFTAMTLGFSTITADLVPVYARISGGVKHIVNSAVLSILASLVCARIVYPEHDTVKITSTHFPPPRSNEHSALETASKGSVQGLRIVGLVLATLICVSLFFRAADTLFAWLCANVGVHDASMQWVAGVAMMPVAFLTGVTWRDCHIVGPIIATKILVNEFVAFQELKNVRDEDFQERSRVLATYAICSFGNIAEFAAAAGALEVLRMRHVEEVMALTFPALATGCVVSLYNACIVDTGCNLHAKRDEAVNCAFLEKQVSLNLPAEECLLPP